MENEPVMTDVDHATQSINSLIGAKIKLKMNKYRDLSMAQPKYMAITRENQILLSSFGVKVRDDDFGKNNNILFDCANKDVNIDLFTSNAVDSLIVIGGGGALSGQFDIHGSRHICCIASIGRYAAINTLRVEISGENLFYYVGSETTVINAYFILNGVDRHIIVGDDCMFSWNIVVRNSDGHGIFDLVSSKSVNEPGNVELEDHVWIGQDVLIMNSSHIGKGTVVGARALVVSDLPACSVCVGAPARPIRSGVSWTRNSTDAFEREEVKKRLI